MKTTVLAIHGGGEYISLEGKSLEEEVSSRKILLERLRQRPSWKSKLQEDLGVAYDVLSPRMPQPDTPTYTLWKILFEKILPQIDANAVFVGHSLGGIFLARYFSEHKSRGSIRGLFLIAAPYNNATNELFFRSGFYLSDSVKNLNNVVKRTFLYHSTDDPVVPIEHLIRYKNILPHATVRTFPDRGHFNGEHFPELVADIRSI